MIPLLWFAVWSGTVEGTAFDRVTKAPVAGVVVIFGSYRAETDAAGAFRIEDVAEGAYTAAILSPRNFLAPVGRAFQVGERAAKLDIPMIPMGSMRGRVLDPDGNPAAKATVEIFRAYGSEGAFETTDAEGRFAHAGFVPGAYRVRVRSAVDAWASTYFPGTTDPALSEAIFVREGVEIGGIDIRARTAPVYRLRGVVKDNEGRPAAGVTIMLNAPIGKFKTEAMAQSDADGVFEFPKVPAGSWLLQGETQRDQVKWQGLAEVIMPSRDFEKAELRIDPPIAMPVRFEGPPREQRKPVLLLFEGAGDRSGIMVEGGGSSYFYPGRYAFGLINGSPGYYVKGVFLKGRDVSDEEFELGPVSPLRVVIAPNAARATGLVENGPGTKVVMISTGRRIMQVQTADDKGNFTFEGLRPGDWLAFAFNTSDNMNTAAIRELVFDRGLARTAAITHLNEGETANLKLKISPWFE